MTESSPPPITERFLDFTLTVEWELKNPDSSPGGYFKIFYPTCFPLYIEPSCIPVTEEQTSESVTVNCCVDAFFIDAAFRNPFTFILQYSRDNIELNPETPQEKTTDNFVPGKILLDGSTLFLPDAAETMISIEDLDNFSKVTFSMYCESQLLTDECYNFFAPCFIHLKALSAMPPSSSDEAPLFYICKIKNADFNILSHGAEIDTVIPVEYREQDTITVQVRNHEKYLPSNLIGSGFIYSYNGNAQPSQNFGVASFDLLPERKKRSVIIPSNESGNNRSDFKNNNYELIYHIIDPSSGIDPIPADRGPIPRPSPEKMKPVVDDIPPDGTETEASILAREKESTKLNRWVFTCSRSDGTWSYATKILHYVQSYHKHVCKLQSPPPLAPMAASSLPDSSLPANLKSLSNTTCNSEEQAEIRKYAFERFYRKSKDIITGVQIITPSEQIIILETRGQEPMGSAKGLEHLLRSFDPSIAHVLANKPFFFKPPRLYCLCDNAISKINLPLSMSDLLRIEGLYFPKSPNYKFYPVLTKLSHIFECNTLIEMQEGNLFPTLEELMFLLSMAGVFYTIPFQKGMPPMSMSASHGPVKANFGNSPEPAPKVAKATRATPTPPTTTTTANTTSNTGKNSQKTSKKDGSKNKNKNSTTDLTVLTPENENNDSPVENEMKKKSQVTIREYPHFDMPEGLLFAVKKNSLAKSTIITPLDRLTNYSLTMTPNQRQMYKTRHARMERMRREDEWYEAVQDFNKSQERMSKTYDEKRLKDDSNNDTGFQLNIGLIHVAPPPSPHSNTSPRRNSQSQRYNFFSPRNQNRSFKDTV